LTSDYGNIEVIRAMILLNSIFPEIETGDMKLGQIKVISPSMGTHVRQYDINDIVKNHLPKIFETVKEYNPDLKV
jgi:hypothetical protein